MFNPGILLEVARQLGAPALWVTFGIIIIIIFIREVQRKHNADRKAELSEIKSLLTTLEGLSASSLNPIEHQRIKIMLLDRLYKLDKSNKPSVWYVTLADTFAFLGSAGVVYYIVNLANDQVLEAYGIKIDPKHERIAMGVMVSIMLLAWPIVDALNLRIYNFSILLVIFAGLVVLMDIYVR